MSTNTSEVEESFNRSFLLSIRCFAFIISFLQFLHYLNLGTKPMSLQQHLLDPWKQGSTRGCPCRGDNRLCTEACLRLKLQTKQPWREVRTVYEDSLRTNLSQGWENAIFQIYIMVICSPMFLIDLSRYFSQRRRFLPPGAFTFPASSFHVPLETRSILFLTKYDKIIS